MEEDDTGDFIGGEDNDNGDSCGLPDKYIQEQSAIPSFDVKPCATDYTTVLPLFYTGAKHTSVDQYTE